MTFEVRFPPLVRIGGGALDDIGAVLSRLGMTRPLIVTDGFIATSGLLERLVRLLDETGSDAAAFTDTVADPTTASVEQALELVSRHRADGLIAVGGGSPMDTAKAIAVLAHFSGTMDELKSPATYDGPALPIIAIPTTAGTGSEATRFTVITDSRTGEKMLCAGDSYLPAAAIVDHELSLTMPPRLTADTGIDALTHAVEAYVSRRANPVSDALALAAMGLIGRHLRAAFHDGDRHAREQMMTAATLAGMAFSNASVALVHGMSRPLGAHFHIAHGLANAMLFAEVASFSVPAAVQRYAACARAMGIGSDAHTHAELAALLVDELRGLSRDLGVPTPAEVGVDREAWARLVPTMVEQAIASGSPANNPRVPSPAEIADIYHRIYAGR